MSQSDPIAALQQEVVSLKMENQRLKRSLLQHTMERAVLDEQMSPALLSHIEQFFSPPITPWYLCILFFGADATEPMPETAPIRSTGLDCRFSSPYPGWWPA